ncbi:MULTISPECIES: hypothetical protein [unclassified Bradyrhizobium]|uniref:hypothetical protein n=1 Tax=unclassified Bradyrhizobium TaxID=2631580 RepID=UPI001FF750AE|nr:MULTISPECIES: hypothetical protein [unclassified Bradyrhizobium]MCK1707908.1 hypothetical protein [Bradyrhizobium sp. 143]MCK1725672.1 hypothetical protein [Bradyrhizobium sp. 142]
MAIDVVDAGHDALLKLVFWRPPEIEASIDEALGQKPEEQLRRANIRDPADSAYMSSECLVHLVREARLSGDKRAVDRLLIPLMSRCERRLKRTIPDSRPDAQGRDTPARVPHESAADPSRS